MDQRKAVISVIVVVALVFLLIGGTIFYLSRVFSSGSSSSNLSNNSVVTSSNLPQTATSNIVNATPVPSNFKTYSGKGFQLQYPKTWGLLTCSNSQNIEFDPTNVTDQLNVRCDVALKPVTVLVNRSCSLGAPAMLGNISVSKSVENSATGVDYEWCTKTAVPLDITHRVSSDGSRATSTQDYSSQVEQIVQSYATGGS